MGFFAYTVNISDVDIAINTNVLNTLLNTQVSK